MSDPVVLRHFLSEASADTLFDLLAPRMVYDHLGRANGFFDVLTPRDVAEREVAELMRKASEALEVDFSIALWQGYRNHEASTALHRDDYAAQLIVSLGATRPFWTVAPGDEHRWTLGPGDAVFFPPHSQDEDGWRHGVPACSSPRGERIAVVFRQPW